MKSLFTWLLIIVPLGWGVWMTVKKSEPLFTGGAPPAAAAPK